MKYHIKYEASEEVLEVSNDVITRTIPARMHVSLWKETGDECTLVEGQVLEQGDTCTGIGCSGDGQHAWLCIRRKLEEKQS